MSRKFAQVIIANTFNYAAILNAIDEELKNQNILYGLDDDDRDHILATARGEAEQLFRDLHTDNERISAWQELLTGQGE